MTDREPPDDDQDDSDWLSAQFDPTGELPKQAPTPPAVPPTRVPPNRTPPQPPVQPPVQQPPAQQPPAQVPPVQVPPVQQPPAQVPPAQYPPTQYPPAQFPPAQQPVAPQFPMAPAAPAAPAQPAFPPAAQQGPPPQLPRQQPASPPQPLAPQQPVAPQVPVQTPTAPPPAAPAQGTPPQGTPPQGGGFSWGLTPGGAAPTPAVTPPVTPPVTPAAAAVPPAAPVVPAAPATPPAPPAPWYTPVAADPATPPVPPAVPPASTTPGQPLPGQPLPGHPLPGQPLPPYPPEQTPLDTAIAGPAPEGEPPSSPMPFETTVLPDVAPDSRDAPPFWEPEPTQMMDALDIEPPAVLTRPSGPVSPSVFTDQFGAATGIGQVTGTSPGVPASPGTEQVSAIDALFGESQFREYTEGLAPDPSENPFARREFDPTAPAAPGSGSLAGPAPGTSRTQKILLGILGGLLAALALVALFFLGTRLPSLLGPAPAVAVPSASPSPSAQPDVAVGPVAPGDYHWDQLLGGECIDPYTGPWEDDYTVVPCTDPHAAQMVRTGEFPPAVPDADGVVDDTYPGEDALQAIAITLCRQPGIFSPAAAALTDAVVQVSYTVSPDSWAAGRRIYSCFVTLSSGAPMTADVALPQVAPVDPDAVPVVPVDPKTGFSVPAG